MNDPRPEDLPSFNWPQQSAFAKEMRKWEKLYRFERFPAMLYKAKKRPSGGPFLCVDPDDEAFSRTCQCVVRNEDEYSKATREGWRDSPQDAIGYALELEEFVSNAAAHRHHEDRNMGEGARAEAQMADSASMDHLPEIIEQRRHRGRPRKTV